VRSALRFSPEALEQLEALEAFIAQAASAHRAAHYVDAIIRYCENLTTFPMRGVRRDDLRPGMRTVGFKRRVTILFTVTPGTVTILGVYYGGQNYDADFAPRRTSDN